METMKRARLEAAGFMVGTSIEFLGLTQEENALIETNLAMSTERQTRQPMQTSQAMRNKEIEQSAE